MKKTLFALTLILVLALSACGAAAAEPAPEAPAEEAAVEEPQVEKTPEVEEPIQEESPEEETHISELSKELARCVWSWALDSNCDGNADIAMVDLQMREQTMLEYPEGKVFWGAGKGQSYTFMYDPFGYSSLEYSCEERLQAPRMSSFDFRGIGANILAFAPVNVTYQMEYFEYTDECGQSVTEAGLYGHFVQITLTAAKVMNVEELPFSEFTDWSSPIPGDYQTFLALANDAQIGPGFWYSRAGFEAYNIMYLAANPDLGEEYGEHYLITAWDIESADSIALSVYPDRFGVIVTGTEYEQIDVLAGDILIFWKGKSLARMSFGDDFFVSSP